MSREPEYLKDGARIALVAPSCGGSSEPYTTKLKASIQGLKRMGYQVEEGPNIFLDRGVVASNTPELRAEEFTSAYLGDADAVISVGGGELMCEMLPYVDFERITAARPKWFMGFSDNTNLTFTLTTLCDLVTIYGPCGDQFGLDPLPAPSRDALDMLRGKREFRGYPTWELTSLVTPENPLAPLNLTERKVITPIGYSGPMEGILLGGCLDCLVTLCGTRFDRVREYTEKHGGIIWFLEACDLHPVAIRRALFQLRQAGWFDTAVGFLFGRPLCYDNEYARVNRFQAVQGALGDLGLPILMDIDLGHLPPALPIKCGAEATLSLEDGNIVFRYAD